MAKRSNNSVDVAMIYGYEVGLRETEAEIADLNAQIGELKGLVKEARNLLGLANRVLCGRVAIDAFLESTKDLEGR